MRELCRHCGTSFPLELKPSGEVGRVEGIRFVKWDPRPISRWQLARWWVAAHLYDAANWLGR